MGAVSKGNGNGFGKNVCVVVKGGKRRSGFARRTWCVRKLWGWSCDATYLYKVM